MIPDPLPTESDAPPRAVDPVRLLEPIVEPVVTTMGFELCHLEWSGQAGHRVLRVYLDHPDGVGLDDCARLSRIVGNALDAAESHAVAGELARLLSGPYTLEVSSPGLSRPLGRRSHFERFAGRRVTVKTRVPPFSGSPQRVFHGFIEGTKADPTAPGDDRAGFVLVRGDAGESWHIPLEQVRRAHLVDEGQ